MKKHITLCLAIATVISLSLTLYGCHKETQKTETSQRITLAVGTQKDSVHLDVELPTYPDPKVNQAIMEQLNEALGGTYEGEYADVDSFSRHYVKAYLAEMDEMHTADEDTYEEGMEFMTHFERNLNISKIYENERLVTFNIQYYQYNGGAHGLNEDYGMTFRKSDGRQMGKNVLNNSIYDEEWQKMMHNGLMEYFEVSTEEELAKCLFESDLFLLQMPQADPCFIEDGLLFTYQQYEIAAYAYGMPSFVIPYNKLASYLNVTGQRLLEK